MKLQIVEYKLTDIFNGCCRYRYTLEIDRRLILQFESMDKRFPKDYITNKLINNARYITDQNLEHYPRFNTDNIPDISNKILFEQEVSDHYFKDIKIQQRIKELERDFENDQTRNSIEQIQSHQANVVECT